MLRPKRVGWFVWVVFLLGCNGGTTTTEQPTDAAEEQDETVFVPAPAPELVTETDRTDAPLYIFVYTHTEDHINHEVSEERYTTLAPMVEQFVSDHPALQFAWTIQFGGADAQTVAENSDSTHIVDTLTTLAEQGVVHFGYHGQHDPTYQNRATNDLTTESSWEEIVEAVDEWISCEKDPYRGGCLAETGGGIMAIEQNFGDVEVVSGVAAGDGTVGWESRGGRHAISRRAPNRMVGFGFSDHGPDTYPTYDQVVAELMTELSPSAETSGSLFWMDDVIRINDGDPVQGVTIMPIHYEIRRLRQSVDAIDRSRPHVFNALMASKYIYTAAGVSPTQHAYLNPDDPMLPEDLILDEEDIATNYDRTQASLHYLADILDDGLGSQFVGPDDVIELVAPDHYFVVTFEELDAIASWLYHNWGEHPPAFASDGLEFYSLRDTLGLFATAVASDFSDPVELGMFFGPLEEEESAATVSVAPSDVEAIASVIVSSTTPDATWQPTPNNVVPSQFETEAGTLNASQALYALMMLYASTRAEVTLGTIEVPETEGVPTTYGLLLEIGCLSCVDTAWSLKPARIHQ